MRSHLPSAAVQLRVPEALATACCCYTFRLEYVPRCSVYKFRSFLLFLLHLFIFRIPEIVCKAACWSRASRSRLLRLQTLYHYDNTRVGQGTKFGRYARQVFHFAWSQHSDTFATVQSAALLTPFCKSVSRYILTDICLKTRRVACTQRIKKNCNILNSCIAEIREKTVRYF